MGLYRAYRLTEEMGPIGHETLKHILFETHEECSILRQKMLYK